MTDLYCSMFFNNMKRVEEKWLKGKNYLEAWADLSSTLSFKKVFKLMSLANANEN